MRAGGLKKVLITAGTAAHPTCRPLRQWIYFNFETETGSTSNHLFKIVDPLHFLFAYRGKKYLILLTLPIKL